jgi:hypothetical protein
LVTISNKALQVYGADDSNGDRPKPSVASLGLQIFGIIRRRPDNAAPRQVNPTTAIGWPSAVMSARGKCLYVLDFGFADVA